MQRTTVTDGLFAAEVDQEWVGLARQADAVYRLGLITEKRRRGLQKRFDKQAAEEVARADAIQVFFDDIGFCPDVSLGPTAPGERPPPLVTDTEYYKAGLRFLTREQRAEYAWVFFREPDLMRVRRYTHTRLDEILRFVILGDGLSQSDRLISECNALEAAAKPGQKGGAAKDSADAISFLERTGSSERHERLDLLQRLHAIEPEADPDAGLFVEIGLDENMMPQVLPQGSDWRLCVSTNWSYFALIQAPVHVLHTMLTRQTFLPENEWGAVRRRTGFR